MEINYNELTNDELDAEFVALQAQYYQLERFYNRIPDGDTAKQMHRITRKQAIIQYIITKNNRYEKSVSSKLIIKKLENKINDRDLRIAKLLREVERYKKLAELNLHKKAP